MMTSRKRSNSNLMTDEDILVGLFCILGGCVHSLFQGVMQMICAWQEFLKLLPITLRQQVDRRSGKELEELRLRVGYKPELVFGNRSLWLDKPTDRQDVRFIVNAVSQYSPWAATSMANGFITAPGGHRIGFCGDVVTQNGCITGIREVSSLCMRVARAFPGISGEGLSGSVLIIGKPGSGKTTLLRDLIRQRSEQGKGSVCVVDERGELFPMVQGAHCFDPGPRTDILSACDKANGTLMLLRTMRPGTIAVDEITAEQDCDALMNAGWCGVSLLATAHAADRNDLLHRPVYRSIVSNRLFDTLVIMQPDKSWRAERM